jgi:biopolymer transport protein ExbB
MNEIEAISAVRDFVELGGDVLLGIALLTSVMWTLIIERVVYFSVGHKAEVARAQKLWAALSEHASWDAQQIRRMLVSEVKLKLERGLSMINTAVALCPMFGLLGTVTGMIEVFDVMAAAGSSNARGMAAGVSKATLPTMAGMVAAISGMLFSVQLGRFANNESTRVEESLELPHQQE